MSEILTLEEYDAALNVGYTAGYHDGAFPQEPSYSEQFEATRGTLIAHDAALRKRVATLEAALREIADYKGSASRWTSKMAADALEGRDE